MFSRFFIERPIFAAVVAIIICLAGAVSMTCCRSRSIRRITPVQVTVSATYPGADSQTLADSVASPIEQQINGVDNMLYMSSISSSSTGQLTMTVYFSLDTDPDIAQVQVQNRVNLAMPQLPSAVVQQGVIVQKKSSSIMMLVAVFAKDDRYSAELHRELRQRLRARCAEARQRRGPGADHGRAQPGDAHLDESGPHGLARHHDHRHRQRDQPAEPALRRRPDRPAAQRRRRSSSRSRSSRSRSSPSPSSTRTSSCARSQDGSAIVRVGDVARAEIGLQQYIVDSQMNGTPATFIAVYQQPGANGLDRVEGGAQDDGADEGALPGRDGLHHLARHQRLRAAVDQGGDQDAVRGDRAGRAGRLPVPAELPHHAHLHRGDRRRADRARSPACSRWASRSTCSRCSGWCSRSAWSSTTRSSCARTSSATWQQHHLAPKEATIKVDGRDRELARRRRAGDVLGVHSGRVPARHHRPALQAVRDHHRDLGVGVGLRRADADAGDVRGAAEAQPAAARAGRSPGSTARSTA